MPRSIDSEPVAIPELSNVEPMAIGERMIGPGCPTLVVAELSCNHKQNLKIALDTIRAMAEVGVDAVKLQTYTPSTLTLDSDKPPFRIGGETLWDGMTLFELYKQAYTPWEWHQELWELARSLGMEVFSTPFDYTAVDFLRKFKPVAYKIASFEANDPDLIEYAAKERSPMIISTGMSTLEEIQLGVRACRAQGNNQIVLLKCTSAYPAPMTEVNLRTIPNMEQTFGVIVGLSDHTVGIEVPVAAVALGAKLVEKHFILDREKVGGPDKEFSLEPQEFEAMIKGIRNVELALGRVSYDLSEKVEKSRVFARSLFVAQDIRKGEVFTPENLRSIRPGYGLQPRYYREVIGKKATRDIEAATPLELGMFE